MDFTNLDTLGARIKAIRISKGLTMEEFANLLGATKGNVSIWEANKSQPNNSRLKKIAEMANISADELLHNYSHVEVCSNIESISKYFLDGDDNALTFKLSALMTELKPRVDEMGYGNKLALLMLFYSYIDEHLRNELLFMIANDIRNKKS